MLVEDNIEGGGGHNWEKYFIGLFHVSEHVDHFKAIKYFREKKREIVWSGGSIVIFFLNLHVYFTMSALHAVDNSPVARS